MPWLRCTHAFSLLERGAPYARERACALALFLRAPLQKRKGRLRTTPSLSVIEWVAFALHRFQSHKRHDDVSCLCMGSHAYLVIRIDVITYYKCRLPFGNSHLSRRKVRIIYTYPVASRYLCLNVLVVTYNVVALARFEHRATFVTSAVNNNCRWGLNVWIQTLLLLHVW